MSMAWCHDEGEAQWAAMSLAWCHDEGEARWAVMTHGCVWLDAMMREKPEGQ